MLPDITELTMPDRVLEDVLISESDVFDALCALDTTKAMGIDALILKSCALPLHMSII